MACLGTASRFRLDTEEHSSAGIADRQAECRGRPTTLTKMHCFILWQSETCFGRLQLPTPLTRAPQVPNLNPRVEVYVRLNGCISVADLFPYGSLSVLSMFVVRFG